MADQNERVVVDPQTGEIFTLLNEDWRDIFAAWISIVYSLVVILYLGWVLLDTWTREATPEGGFWHLFQGMLLYSPVYKLMVYTAIGGAIGAAVNNIRSFVHWHAELRAFGWRFVWKYISLPPLGATLAVMVYAIIQGGVAMFTGGVSGDGPISAMSSFAAWATGALAGYGSHKVFIWLDDKVNSLFKVESQTAKVDVPDVSGKTPGEAEQTLIDGKLALGEVTDAVTDEPEKIGKVMSQTPVAGTKADANTEVAITIGKAGGGETAKVDVPDVSGKTREEAEQALTDGKLTLGEVSEEVTSEEQNIGKVMSQTPVAGTKADANTGVAITVGKASDGE